MSFILNALRKSEQERLSNHAETLEDKILPKHGSVQKNHPGWLLILILILINVLLIAFFFLHFTQQEKEVTAEKSVTVAEQLKTPVHTEEGKALIVTEQAKTLTQKNEEKTAQSQDTGLINTPQVSIAQQIKNQQQKVIYKPVVSLKTEKTIKPPKVKQAQPSELTKSRVAQEIKIQKAELVVNNKENNLPYLSEMPYEFQLSVPHVNINVFVYTKHPEGRFIMVNMQKYRVGELINEEMQLQEIRPDSIVVKYQGKVFQIRQ